MHIVTVGYILYFVSSTTMVKKLTVLFVAFVACLYAHADTFVVTSNADSGPGSLRDAIEKANANGTSIQDVIQFSLPDLSIEGRTITIKSGFPDLLSNLVIDGSTQMGNKIGVSDAKIRITTGATVGVPYVFRILNAQNISFFGLHLDDVKLESTSMLFSAIALQSARNVLIGEPQKGNYFTRVAIIIGEAYVFQYRGLNENIVFKSNIVNLSEDGNSLVSQAIVFSLNNVRNFTLGGETEQDGNFISTINQFIGSTYTDTFAHVNMGKYIVMNNKFGSNYSQTAGLPCGALYFRNGNNYGYTDTTDIIIKNNTFGTRCASFNCSGYNFIMLENKKGFIDIKRNIFGVSDKTLNYFYSTGLTAISIVGCEDGIIGGEDPLDANIIAGQRGYAVALGGNRAITITKNSIFCNSAGIKVNSARLPVPKTKIFSITDYVVEGTTLPMSKVEVFLTKQCAGCDNGELYLGYTTADNTGKWTFTSPVLLDGAVTATGTSPDGVTGEFAKPEYGFSNFDYKAPTCQQDNGYIRGLQFVAGTRYYWVREWMGASDTLFNQLDVENAKEGHYKFIVEQGKYCSVIYSVLMTDISPKINAQYVRLVNPTCGKNNGGIFSISAGGSYNKVMWKDEKENIVSDKIEADKFFEGKYKLVILDTTYGCGDSTNYFSLINQSGPTLTTGTAEVSHASCSNANGSIKNITVGNTTGYLSFQWLDSANQVVSTYLNLVNVPAGKYRLKFKDQSGCDTITTPYYTINDVGAIAIDTANKSVVPSSCNSNSGSIGNIQITGGEKYEWLNASGNQPVGNGRDVNNLAAGTYLLKVSNSKGCEKLSPTIIVPSASFVPINVVNSKIEHASCDLQNGSVTVLNFDKNTTDYSFHWKLESTNETIGAGTAISHLSGGNYLLYAKDGNNCEGQIFKAEVKTFPKPVFDYSGMNVQTDQCSQTVGSITGIKINGLQGPTTYNWTNMSNVSVGNSLSLQNTGTGEYQLHIVDGGNCSIESKAVVVTNRNETLSKPLYDNQVIPRNTTTTLTIRNPQPGNYYLFHDPLGLQPVQTNTSGTFITGTVRADSIFYIRYEKGSCRSDITDVRVTVVDETKVFVPTAFTPNKDGKNDLLRPVVSGLFDLEYFIVFDRWGTAVFRTNELSKGWDGRYKGMDAPVGVYVWLLKGKDIFNNWIEQKGSFVLIR